MMKISKPSLLQRVRDFIGYRMYRLCQVRSGPFMFYAAGQWLYVDFRGRVYRITPAEWDDGCPLRIELLWRP